MFLIVYGILLWRSHGILHMKDRLGHCSRVDRSGLALTALMAVVLYVVVKGAPVVFAHFPQFLLRDMTGGENGESFGMGAAIVGTVEQVAIATVLSVPIAYLTATYMVESREPPLLVSYAMSWTP